MAKEYLENSINRYPAACGGELHLEKRAKRGNREKFLEILSKVPDVEPEAFDKL